MRCFACREDTTEYFPVSIDENGQMQVACVICYELNEKDYSMATVKIENIEQARLVAPEYGVDFPAGKGRPPVRKLAAAILEAGHVIEDTAYFTAAMAQRNWQTNQHKADLEAIVAAGQDALSVAQVLLDGLTVVTEERVARVSTPAVETEYLVKASVPNRNGKGRHPAKVTLTVGQIREATNSIGVRGRVSQSNVLEAAARLKSWGPVDALKGVSVERVSDAPVVAAEPVSDVVPEQDTTEAVDVVSDAHSEDAAAKLSVLQAVSA